MTNILTNFRWMLKNRPNTLFLLLTGTASLIVSMPLLGVWYLCIDIGDGIPDYKLINLTGITVLLVVTGFVLMIAGFLNNRLSDEVDDIKELIAKNNRGVDA